MTRFFVRHPVTTWMVFLMFVVLGIYSVPRLRIEAMPEVDLPTLTVSTSWPGASPQAVQRSITIPIEEAVANVYGVENVKSRSGPGFSSVEVSLRRDVKIDFARLDLNEQLGNVRRTLPLGASQPRIVAFIPEEFQTEDFFAFIVESPIDPNELRDLAESWIVPEMLSVEGVADVQVMGGAMPILKIVLDRRKLDLYGIRADEVFAAIDRLDEFTAAGKINENGMEKLVAIREPVDMETIEDAVIARRGGQTFTLAMVGEVRPDFEDPTYIARSNGKNVVRVSVEKQSGENSIEVSRALRKAMPQVEESLPFEATFFIEEDSGEELEDKLRELVYRSFAILGILFMLLVITLRQVRLTAIITGSIVFAVVISLSLFYFLDISVNFITISGLTVCFGLILDNSILVLDSIHRRLDALKRADEQNLSRKAKLRVAIETIVEGTQEVLFPILATTLTTIVAFASFIFLTGRLALYYVPLAISVTTALIASLFIAFAWVPTVLERFWARPIARDGVDGDNDVTDQAALSKFVEEKPAHLNERPPLIERMFSFNQRIAWVVLPLCAVIFLGGWHVWDTKIIKGGFWRFPEQEVLFLYLEMPSGTDIELTSQTLLEFETLLVPLPEGSRMTSRVFGTQAIINVEFDDKIKKTETPMFYRALLIDKADQMAGTSVFIRGFSDRPYFKGAFGGSALNSLVKITGYNSKRLGKIADATLARVEKNRRARNARITTGSQFERIRQEEMVIGVHRERLAAHDLSVLELVGQIRRLLGVDSPFTMLIEGEQERVQLSYDDADNISFTDIAEMTIRNASGEQIRLGELIDIQLGEVSRSITRENQKYTVHVNWEYLGTEQMRVKFIKDILAGIQLPYGYEAEEATREFLTSEEEEELGMAIWLSVAFIFFVLAALFESVSLPILVLVSVPMALVGVVVTFWLTNSTFDSSARIGLILLFGVVVNNAILLVSRFRIESSLILKDKLGGDPTARAALFPGLRKQLGGSDLYALDRKERPGLLRRAISRGTHVRMRSILLTSGTTVAGLAPLLIHLQETDDKDIWENLALASIGGLVASTILLIFAMPPLYYYCIRVAWGLRRFFEWFWVKIRRSSRKAEVAGPEPQAQ